MDSKPLTRLAEVKAERDAARDEVDRWRLAACWRAAFGVRHTERWRADDGDRFTLELVYHDRKIRGLVVVTQRVPGEQVPTIEVFDVDQYQPHDSAPLAARIAWDNVRAAWNGAVQAP